MRKWLFLLMLFLPVSAFSQGVDPVGREDLYQEIRPELDYIQRRAPMEFTQTVPAITDRRNLEYFAEEQKRASKRVRENPTKAAHHFLDLLQNAEDEYHPGLTTFQVEVLIENHYLISPFDLRDMIDASARVLSKIHHMSREHWILDVKEDWLEIDDDTRTQVGLLIEFIVGMGQTFGADAVGEKVMSVLEDVVGNTMEYYSNKVIAGIAGMPDYAASKSLVRIVRNNLHDFRAIEVSIIDVQLFERQAFAQKQAMIILLLGARGEKELVRSFYNIGKGTKIAQNTAAEYLSQHGGYAPIPYPNEKIYRGIGIGSVVAQHVLFILLSPSKGIAPLNQPSRVVELGGQIGSEKEGLIRGLQLTRKTTDIGRTLLDVKGIPIKPKPAPWVPNAFGGGRSAKPNPGPWNSGSMGGGSRAKEVTNGVNTATKVKPNPIVKNAPKVNGPEMHLKSGAKPNPAAPGVITEISIDIPRPQEWTHPDEQREQYSSPYLPSIPSPYDEVSRRNGEVVSESGEQSPPGPERLRQETSVIVGKKKYVSDDGGLTWSLAGVVSPLRYRFWKGAMVQLPRPGTIEKDYFLWNPPSQPKFELRNHVRANLDKINQSLKPFKMKANVPEGYASLKEAIDSGNHFFMNSEQPDELVGGSGIGQSYKVYSDTGSYTLDETMRLRFVNELEKLIETQGKWEPFAPSEETLLEDAIAIYRETGELHSTLLEAALWWVDYGGRDSVLRPYLEYREMDPVTFVSRASFSYGEFIFGKNGMIVGDSSDPDTFYIRGAVTTAHGLSPYVVVREGKVYVLDDDGLRSPTKNDQLPPERIILGLVEFYRGVTTLQQFSSAYVPLVEFQLTDSDEVYFLQYHLTAEKNRSDFKIQRPLAPGEFEALFVRGKTSREGVFVRMHYGQNEELLRWTSNQAIGLEMSPSTSTKGEGPRAKFEANAFREALVRDLDLYFVDPDDLDWPVKDDGHTQNSILFKPKVSAAVEMPDQVYQQIRRRKEQFVKETGSAKGFSVDFWVVSDGKRCIIRLLDEGEELSADSPSIETDLSFTGVGGYSDGSGPRVQNFMPRAARGFQPEVFAPKVAASAGGNTTPPWRIGKGPTNEMLGPPNVAVEEVSISTSQGISAASPSELDRSTSDQSVYSEIGNFPVVTTLPPLAPDGFQQVTNMIPSTGAGRRIGNLPPTNVTNLIGPPPPPGQSIQPERSEIVDGKRYLSRDGGLTWKVAGLVSATRYRFVKKKMIPIEPPNDSEADYYVRNPTDKPKFDLRAYVRKHLDKLNSRFSRYKVRVPEGWASLKEAVDSGKDTVMNSEHRDELVGSSGTASSHFIDAEKARKGKAGRSISFYIRELQSLKNDGTLLPDSPGAGWMIRDFIATYRETGKLPQRLLEENLWWREYVSKRSTLRSFLKYSGIEPHAYIKNASYSYGEFIPGNNGMVIADSSNPNRYYVYLGEGERKTPIYVVQDEGKLKNLQKEWLLFNGGTEILDQDGIRPARDNDGVPSASLLYSIVRFYKGVVELPRLKSDYVPLLEFQVTENNEIYFLQYHLTAEADHSEFKLARALEPGEVKATFVRGRKTGPEGVVVTMYVWPNREMLSYSGDQPLAFAMTPRNALSFSLYDGADEIMPFTANGFREAIVRSLSVYLLRPEDLMLDGGKRHSQRSLLFKPDITLAVDISFSSWVRGQFEVGEDRLIDPEPRKFRVRVTNDGTTAYVKILGEIE